MSEKSAHGGTADDRIETATQLIAEVRARCVSLGLTPRQFADILLPEALLAMMVSGMKQEEVENVFRTFAQEEIAAWYMQVKRTAGYCDCEREARGEHSMSCALAGAMPLVEQIRN
jgi:hypothetical protein